MRLHSDLGAELLHDPQRLVAVTFDSFVNRNGNDFNIRILPVKNFFQNVQEGQAVFAARHSHCNPIATTYH